jgi:hypothetical protein
MQRLYVDDNGLKELPSCIGVLTMMTELRVAGNEIEELPGSIGMYVCGFCCVCMYVCVSFLCM